jgi:hypothetical protein
MTACSLSVRTLLDDGAIAKRGEWSKTSADESLTRFISQRFCLTDREALVV